MKRDVRSRLRKITTMATSKTSVGGRDRKIMKAKPITLPQIEITSIMPKFVVVGYERDRYHDGFVVKAEDAPWGEFIADFPDGQSKENRIRAQSLADTLNKTR